MGTSSKRLTGLIVVLLGVSACDRGAAECQGLTVVAASAEANNPDVLTLSDGHVYEATSLHTTTYASGHVVKFRRGDKAYLCYGVHGSPPNEPWIVDNPDALNWGGTFSFHRLR